MLKARFFKHGWATWLANSIELGSTRDEVTAYLVSRKVELAS